MPTVASATNTNTNTAAIAAAASGGSGLDTQGVNATQDRFLKLLVAQIRNQDPLNPLQNSEVTSQLAQLSTVTGINRLTEQVSGLSNTFAEAQSLQAANIIGRGVIVPGKTLDLAGDKVVAAVDLPKDVEQLSITIRNAAGAIVHTANLGPQSSGLVKFQWDGKDDNGNTLAQGKYTYAVQGSVAGRAIEGIESLTYGRVNSVTLGAQGAQLNVDGLGAIPLSQVKQIV